MVKSIALWYLDSKSSQLLRSDNKLVVVGELVYYITCRPNRVCTWPVTVIGCRERDARADPSAPHSNAHNGRLPALPRTGAHQDHKLWLLLGGDGPLRSGGAAGEQARGDFPPSWQFTGELPVSYRIIRLYPYPLLSLLYRPTSLQCETPNLVLCLQTLQVIWGTQFRKRRTLDKDAQCVSTWCV